MISTKPAVSWRDVLAIHPAAELFPRMTPDELRVLGEDILKNGLTSPIALWRADPKSPLCLLDGRNRLDAIELGTGSTVEIGAPSLMAGEFLATDKVIVLDGRIDPYSYVVSANIHRRHLNVEQRQHLLIELIARAPGKSDRQIGKEIGVDHKTIARARTKGEDVGRIPHVDTHTDSKGRKQPARKPKGQSVEPRSEVEEIKPNGARALMASRQEPDGLDYFPTPPFATRALIERVLPVLGIRPSDLARMTAWESACGEGHMAEPLAEYFGRVIATDVHDYGYGEAPVDFLDEATKRDADWCITNPPFDDKAIRFVLRALKFARVGVAMFTRLQWLETIERYEQIFRDHPPTLVAVFVERVNLCKGRWEPDGTTATAYCWLIWLHGEAPRPPFWIPPGCREQLTLADDVARFTTHPVTRMSVPPADPGDMPPIPAFLLRRAAS